MSDKLTPVENLPRQLKAALTQIAEPWVVLGQQIRQSFLALENVGQAFNDQIEVIGSSFRKALQPLTDLAARLRDIDPAYIETLLHRFNQLVEDGKLVPLRLAYRGWFLVASPRIPGIDMITLAALFEKGNSDVDQFMMKWVEEKLPVVQDILVNKYPSRRDILESAFRAHYNGQYSLSIPVFLAQADGIYLQLSASKKGVYSKMTEKGGNTVPHSKSYVDGLGVDDELLYLLEPLRVITALGASESLCDQRLLNRHAVMHGNDCDYGTKVNSLKAISHLLYIGTFLDDIRLTDSEKKDDKLPDSLE